MNGKLVSRSLTRMVQLFVLIPPILVIFIVNIFKKLVDDFEVSSLGIDLHINGILYLLLLPLVRKDQLEFILLILTMTMLSLIITSTCYAGARGKLTQRSAKFGKTALCVGAFFFFFGLTMTLVLA